MPNTDDTPAPRSTPRPRFQPSLLGEADPSSRSGPNSDIGQMRMLDELEAVVRPRAAVRASPVNGRVLGWLAAGVALAAAAWWWNPQGSTARPPLPKTLAVGSVQAKPSLVVVASPALAAAPAVLSAPTALSAPADAASAPARIETIAAAAADPVPTVEPAVRPVPGGAPATRPGARAEVVALAKTEPKAAAGKVTTVVTPSGKWTVTVADEAPAMKTLGAGAGPGPSAGALASPAASVGRAEAAKSPKTEDADVLLLSALLAHVSRADANGNLPEQDQLTIAQLVKRCDVRATEEARECRRRICEGYWGKAEACPAPVNSKKG